LGNCCLPMSFWKRLNISMILMLTFQIKCEFLIMCNEMGQRFVVGHN
jgi:hypothetical protein